MTPRTFPSADEIATAVVMAARLSGEDPIDVVNVRTLGSRARVVAMAALQEAFPNARRVGLGECLAFGTPRAAQAAVIRGRQAKHWREEWVDEIVGALVAPLYGEQAA